jgi:hypothetical protein
MYDIGEATAKLLSIYRHDFLNVLQVVGGLAQLNKQDRLLTYIRKASDEVQQFGRFISCGDPRLALLLYETLLQDCSPDSYLIHVKGSLPLLPEHVLEGAQKTLTLFQKMLQSVNDNTISLTISANDGPAVAVRVICDGQINEIWQPVLDAAAQNGLYGSVDLEKSELLLRLDNPGVGREQ